jgi:hypothetical protein
MITDDSSQPTPPPQKRIKSAELYKRQHGLTDEQLMVREHLTSTITQQHALRRDRDKSKDSRERDRSVEMKDSLLSQALEAPTTITITPQVRKIYFKFLLLKSISFHSIPTCNHSKRKVPAKTPTAATQ